MSTFWFHWLTGEVEDGEGYDVADAFRRLGYGGGAINALDYFEVITDKKTSSTSGKEN